MTRANVIEVVGWTVFVMVLPVAAFSAYAYSRGHRSGACVELCRPAKFDADQEVNGGCLCIGSDKVLRIRPAP